MKNKTLITNIASAVLSVLVIAFLALPYMTEGAFSISGYGTFEVLKYLGGVDDFALLMLYLLPLLMMLLAILILAVSVINILGDLNVVKAEKVLKIVKIVGLVIAVLLAVLVIVGMIIILANDAALGIGFILNLIFVVAIAAASVLTIVWGRK